MEPQRSILTSTIGLALSIFVLTTGCADSESASDSTPSAAAAVPATASSTRELPGTGGATSGPPGTATTPATDGEAVIDPGDGGNYEPSIDPAEFVTGIDNPYLPFAVGSRWVYEDSDGEETEEVVVVVTPKRKTVMGIAATVVRDTVRVDGELVEDTYDWFAQDSAGNVWYLGETVKNYKNGRLADRDGSWEAGVDGALPGIVMPADPIEGMAYRQEYLVGEAEDLGEIKAVGGSQDVPAGQFGDVITTTDWNPLEPEVVEEKQYAPGVGLIRETKVAGDTGLVELIEFTLARGAPPPVDPPNSTLTS